jgi:hypothetical protein
MIRFLRQLTNLFAWIQIAISPILIGLIAGIVFYSYLSKPFGLVLGIAITTFGLLLGIRWAEKVRKKNGAVEFMSRVNATAELDDRPKVHTKKHNNVSGEEKD